MSDRPLPRPNDVELIKQLKYRYFRALDTGDIGALRDCFAADAHAVFVGSRRVEIDGRDAIVDLIAAHATRPGFIAVHQGHHPDIRLTDMTTAAGNWYLHDRFLDLAERTTAEGTAFYADTYVKSTDGWRIQSTHYTRVYQEREPWSADKNVFAPVLDRPAGGKTS